MAGHISVVMRMALFVVVLGCAASAPIHAEEASQGAAPQDVVIVRGNGEVWLNRYAAEELRKYIVQMTGTKVPVAAAADVMGQKVILIGTKESNEVIADLIARGIIDAAAMADGKKDGFVIRSVTDGTTEYLALVGMNDRSCLYAVYHYLEQCCDVGFFTDGDAVPEMETVPFDGIAITATTPFYYRGHSPGMRGAAGLKHRINTYWTAEEHKRYFDWMLKRKLNMGSFGGSWIDWAPEGYGSGVGDPQYLKDVDKPLHEYGRERGMMFEYFVRYASDYSQPYNEPDAPRVISSTWQWWKQLIGEFGTDHFYVAPYASESYSMKEANQRALRNAYVLWNAIDPDAVVAAETWNMLSHPYSDEDWKTFDLLVPKPMVILDEYYWGGMYERYHGYGGRPVMLTNHSALCQMDSMVVEPSIRFYEHAYRQTLHDPDVDVVGSFWAPESINTNPIFEHFLTELMWNPDTADYDDFISDYTRKRYGRESYDVMLDSLRSAIAGMAYTRPASWKDNGSGTSYLLNPSTYYTKQLNDEDRRRSMQGAVQWEEALSTALKEKDRLSDNVFYRNYLLDVFKSYCGQMSWLTLAKFSNAYYQAMLPQLLGFDSSGPQTVYMLRFDYATSEFPMPRDYTTLESIAKVENVGFLTRAEMQNMDFPWRWGMALKGVGRPSLQTGSVIYDVAVVQPHAVSKIVLQSIMHCLKEGDRVVVSVSDDGSQWRQVYALENVATWQLFQQDITGQIAGNRFKIKVELTSSRQAEDASVTPGFNYLGVYAGVDESRPIDLPQVETWTQVLQAEQWAGANGDQLETALREYGKIVLIYDQLGKVLASDPRHSVRELVEQALDIPGAPSLAQYAQRWEDWLVGYFGMLTPETIELHYKPLVSQTWVPALQEMGCPADRLPPVHADQWSLAKVMKPDAFPINESESTVDLIARAFAAMGEAGATAEHYGEYTRYPKQVGVYLSEFPKALPRLPIGSVEPIYGLLASYEKDRVKAFDFGVGMAVMPGYEKVMPAMAYASERGWGFGETKPLDSWDESYPDDLYGDFIYTWTPEQPVEFRVDLAEGVYRVTVFVRNLDADVHRLIKAGEGYRPCSVQIACEDEVVLAEVSTEQGQWMPVSFEAKVSDGQLNVEFTSLVDKSWAICGMTIQAK
jgi:hypothetical protein